MAMPLEPARRAPTPALVRGRRHLGRRRPALRPDRGRRLLLRPAEVPRLRRRPLAGRRARPPPSSASSASRASDRWIPASLDLKIALDNSPQGPDLQHAGAGHGLPGRPAGRVDQPERRARVGGRPLRPLGRRPSTAGPRRRRYATPFVADPAQRSHVVATIDLDERGRRQRRVARCCGPTASSTPRATASWAATSSASPCSRPSTPTTSPPSPRCIDHVVAALSA